MGIRRVHFSLKQLFALFIVVSVTVVLIGSTRRTPQKRLLSMFGGKDGIKTVLHADKVLITRLGRLPKHLIYDIAVASDYPVEAGPIEVKESAIRELSSLLVSAETYDWEYAKACGFIPDCKLTFIRQGKSIEVLIAFDCDVLRVFRGDVLLGEEDCDKVHGRLLMIFEKHFPVR